MNTVEKQELEKKNEECREAIKTILEIKEIEVSKKDIADLEKARTLVKKLTTMKVDMVGAIKELMELSGELISDESTSCYHDDGEPITISDWYTCSLCADYYARSTPFELLREVGEFFKYATDAIEEETKCL